MSSSSWDALIADSDLPRLDARALAEVVSGQSRTWLIAHGDAVVSEAIAAQFKALVTRRRQGEPLAYLTGLREFLGRPFEVSPAVLVPRPETELLVEAALDRIESVNAPRLLDLGTGSGVIAVSLALARPDAQVLATDCAADALAVATRNAARHRVSARIRFLQGDWWAALDAQETRFDLIASNPPYLAHTDPHLGSPALLHEPMGALASGPEGLDALRILAAGARMRLAPGGWLVAEHGRDQGAAVRALWTAQGLGAVQTLPDLHGLDRVTVGQRPLLQPC